MSQVRLTKTEGIDAVLSYLRGHYPLFSEAAIIKMALSEKYHETVRKTVDEDMLLSDEQKLEQILLDGVHSERGMEIGKFLATTLRRAEDGVLEDIETLPRHI